MLGSANLGHIGLELGYSGSGARLLFLGFNCRDERRTRRLHVHLAAPVVARLTRSLEPLDALEPEEDEACRVRGGQPNPDEIGLEVRLRVFGVRSGSDPLGSGSESGVRIARARRRRRGQG